MSGELDWAETERRLTDLFGRQPEGSVVRLRAVAQPLAGWLIEITQHAEVLSAVTAGEVPGTEPRLSPESEPTLRALGWEPSDPVRREDHGGSVQPGHWRLELDWPPPAAGYRRLAAGVVGALRDGYGLSRPVDCAYEFLGADGGRLSADLGMPECVVWHYARVVPGDTVDRPAGLLRRTQIGHLYHDEALGRDGEWRPTETLELVELGDLPDRVVRLDPAAADRLLGWWRSLVREERRRAAQRQAAEERHARRDPSLPRVARAVDDERDAEGRPVVRTPRLHERERAAVVAYLRDAPLVSVAYGFDVDPFDPRCPEVVPLNVRTDGEWVWSESLAYFAERHGIGPEPDLMAHLARRGYQLPEVDDERIAKVAEALEG